MVNKEKRGYKERIEESLGKPCWNGVSAIATVVMAIMMVIGGRAIVQYTARNQTTISVNEPIQITTLVTSCILPGNNTQQYFEIIKEPLCQKLGQNRTIYIGLTHEENNRPYKAKISQINGTCILSYIPSCT